MDCKLGIRAGQNGDVLE